MAILLIGGSGNTGSGIARSLQDANIPFLLASRRGKAGAPAGMPAVIFDWLDASTWDNSFQYKFPNGESLVGVYMIAPRANDPDALIISFIDRAVKHGVKRFVLLGGTSTQLGGAALLGRAWQHLIDIGAEYSILRPTWFMDNFKYQKTIRDEGKIYTACGDGKIPFIAANDISAVAFRALTDEKSHDTDHYIVGPELLTHDEIAVKLSKSLGREIVHVRLNEEERFQSYLDNVDGSEFFARFLAMMEVKAANGSEEHMNDVVERLTGRPAQDFDSFIEEHKAEW